MHLDGQARLGLAYALEALVSPELEGGELKRLIEPFAPSTPGYFMYFPTRAQRSTPLRLFVDLAKELLLQGGN